MSLTASVENTFGYDGSQLVPLDEGRIALVRGNGIQIFSLDAHVESGHIQHTGTFGFTCFAACPQTQLIAAAPRDDTPSVLLFSLSSGHPVASLEYEQAGLEFRHLAMSRFDPMNRDALCVTGAGGIYFLFVKDKLNAQRLGCTRGKHVELPMELRRRPATVVPGIFGEESIASLEAPSFQDMPAAGDSQADGPTTEFGYDDIPDSGSDDQDNAGIPRDAAAVAQLVTVPSVNPRDRWTAHVWTASHQVYAANEAGEVVQFDARGEVLHTWVPAGGIMVTSLVLSCEMLVMGCEDGIIRYGSLSENLEITRLTQLAPTSQLGLLAIPAKGKSAPQSLAEGSNPLPIVAMAPSPGYHRLFVGTAGGTLHSLKLELDEEDQQVEAAELQDEEELPITYAPGDVEYHSGAVIGAVVLAGVQPSAESVGLLAVSASIASDGTLKFWDNHNHRLLCQRAFPPVVQAGLQEGSSSAISAVGSTLGDAAQAAQSSAPDQANDPAVLPSGNVLLTSLAAHPRLPLVLVGAADGTIRVVTFAPMDDLRAHMEHNGVDVGDLKLGQEWCAPCLHVDRLHGSAVTGLSFCADPTLPLACTVARQTSEIFFLDTRCAISTLRASSKAMFDGHAGPRDSEGCAGFAVVGVARLQTAEGAIGLINGVTWRTEPSAEPHSMPQTELLLALQTGDVATLPAPELPAGDNPVRSPLDLANPIDLTADLRVRKRLIVVPSAIGLISGGAHASPTVCVVSPMSKQLMMFPANWAICDTNSGTAANAVSQLRPTDPAHVFEGHTKGILSICACTLQNGDTVLGTGGSDGTMGVWQVSTSADLLASQLTRPHASAVASLSLSSDGTSLVSAGLDGVVTFLSLQGDEFIQLSGQASQPEMDMLRALMVRAAAAVYQEHEHWADVAAGVGLEEARLRGEIHSVVSGSSIAPFLTRVQTHADRLAEADNERAKDAIRKELHALQSRLQTLLDANEQAPELEQLERVEFAVDEEGQRRIEQEYREKADALAAEVEVENKRNDTIAARFKKELWDSMDAPHAVVHAIKEPASVANFAIAKLKPKDITMLNQVCRLRQLEQRELAESKEAEPAVPSDDLQTTGPAGPQWAGLLDEVPHDTDWILNCGLLPPTLNPVQQAEELAERKAAAGKPKAAQKAGEGGEEADEAEEDAEDEDADGDEEDDTDRVAAWEGEGILKLLYHPLATRTANQRRTQIVLLGALVRSMQKHFNELFVELQRSKEEEKDKIESRNQRIEAILKELKRAEPVEHVPLFDDERPEHVLEVTDEDIGFEKYVTEAERKQIAEEAERKRLAAAANKDDAPERALDDMMGGTLEAKNEINLLELELQREPWMDELTRAEMTEEQIAELEAFEEKVKHINEEKAKYRKELEEELAKLRAEVAELTTAFDQKIAQMFRTRLEFDNACCSQEMYALRLADTLQAREHSMRTDAKLEALIARTTAQEEQLVGELDRFTADTEACERAVHELERKDKALDRAFKDDLKQELGAIDPVLLKALQQQFKVRTVDADTTGSYGGTQSLLTRSQGTGTSVDGGSDPTKAAMRAAVHAAKKSSALDPYRRADDITYLTDEDAVTRLRAVALQPLPEDQCPDTIDLHQELDRRAWNRMQQLRLHKIEAELSLRLKQEEHQKLTAHMASLRQKLDKMRNKVFELESKRDTLAADQELAVDNLELVVRLTQGQDEIQDQPVTKDYSDAILIDRALVEATNSEVRARGQTKIGILEKIKEFRKQINVMTWENKFLRAQKYDVDEHYMDLHMLRVTKTLQEFIKGGDIAERQRKELSKAEAKASHMKVAHKTKMEKLRKQLAKIEAQVKAKQAENDRLEGQRRELEASVAVRDSIFRSRAHQGGGGDAQPRDQNMDRMKALVTRRKLVDLARAQTDEIEFLRQELERLRHKTFPSFAHVSKLVHGNVDER